MKFIRTAAAALSAAALGVVFSVAAGAAEIPVSATLTSSVIAGKNAAEVQSDDPGYLKYQHNLQQESAKSGSRAAATNDIAYFKSTLKHNSRFNGATKTYGIDVSQYQYNIDWAKAKAAGVQFAIIRLGYRGWGSAGTMQVDPYFKQNIQGAMKAGVKIGVYFYTQAITAAEVKQEAQFCINQLKSLNITKLSLPVYYDIEAVYTGSSAVGRLDGAKLSKAQKTQNCKTFCEEIKKGGFTPGVYSYRNYLYNDIDGAALGKTYDLWLADYTSPSPYTGDYTTWQFSSSGNVSGIPARVDMNVRYGNIPNSTTTDDKEPEVVDYMNVGCSARSTTSITLKWDKQSEASGYLVYQKNSDGTYTYLGPTQTTSYKISGLTAETRYSFKVKPYYNEDSTTDYVSGKSIQGEACPEYKTGTAGVACTDVKAEKASSDSIKVTWSDPNNKTESYDVIRYNPSTREYTFIKRVYETTCTIDKLKNGGYDIAIRANYFNGNNKIVGARSKTARAILNTATVDSIDVKFKNSAMYVWWEDSNSGTEYDVFTKDGDKETQIATSIKAKDIKIDNPVEGKSYTVGVKKKFTYDGEVYTCPVKYFTYTYKLVSPSKVYPSTYNSTATRINWSKVTGATGYKVYMYSPAYKKYVLKKTVSASNLSCAIGGLKLGSAYKFRVRAVFGDKSVPSATFTWGFTKLSAPKKLTALKVGSKSATLRWNGVSHADKYKVYIYNSSKKLVKTVTTKSTKLNVALSSKKLYYIKVKALRTYKTANYVSDYSNRITVKTK